MNKLFGFLFLAIAFFTPDLVQAASRFAVCATTCTWDNTSTAMWAATSGGATGQSAPTTSDSVTLDAATCVGGTTCTITTFAGTITVSSLDMSNCTASTAGCILDASVNNTNFSITGGGGYNNTGSGTRTLNMGGGTWTLASNNGGWGINASATLNAGTSTLTSSSINGFTLSGGGKTYATVIFPAITGTNTGTNGINGSNTFGTLTVTHPNRITFSNSATQTVTTMTAVTGNSTQQSYFAGNVAFGQGAISSAAGWTCSWCVFVLMNFTGGGTFSAPSSFNLGGNTGITITAPSGGGSRGVIGG